MGLQDFMEEILTELKTKLGKGFQAEGIKTLKNNGVAVYGITIRRQNADIAPCIYIDGLFARYLSGTMDVSRAADEIVRCYEENAGMPEMDISMLTDFKEAASMVHGRLINTEMNQELLTGIPHREFLDLSLAYEVRLSAKGENDGSILIHNGFLERWGIEEEDLYGAAFRNLKNNGEATLENMGTVFGHWMKPDVDIKNVPMYILSNKQKINGAAQIFNNDILRLAADIMKGDFAMLPSSIHEWILLPYSRKDGNADEARNLALIVREVNDTQVIETEILSYHVYHYNSENGEVTITA